jgi:hypothetical protein
MSVKFSNGIGYGSKSRAAFFDMSMAVPGAATFQPSRPISQTPIDETDKVTPWAKWGKDNKLPLRMTEDIDNTGILNSIIDGKARFAICNGILPALVHYEKNGMMVIDEILMKPEIDDFLEDNNHFFHTFGWMKDQCGFGNGMGRIMLNKGRDKITSFQRDDVSEMRYEKQDPKSGRINRVYLSAHWDKIGCNVNDNRILRIPLLHWNNPLQDLREKVSNSNAVEFAMTFKYPGWGKKYYSAPLWYAAHKWVKIAQGVPEMKAAMFENNFRPKYMVVVSDKFWTKYFDGEAGDSNDSTKDYSDAEIAQKKNKVYDDIDEHLAGNTNAYKTIFVDGFFHDEKLVSEIEIKPIDDTTKSGELLPDSAAANSEIAFASLFNPAIIGASMPSGPYTNSQGGSNVRESTLIQVIIHELERQNIRRFFNVIKKFNGWDKEYVGTNKKLEFIIPATIPTTLDTGSNVKPMVTGANPVNENQPAA